MSNNPFAGSELALAAELRRRFILEPAEPPAPAVAAKYAPAPGDKKETWRAHLRRLVGEDGDVLFRGLLEIAQGGAWIPTLPDGRRGPVQIPTTTDRREAYEYLINTLFGKPGPQQNIVEAERAAAENSDLKLMSDDQLVQAARKFLVGRVVAASEPAEIVKP